MSAPAASQAPAVAYVPLKMLRAHPDNVRTNLGDLRDLVMSIRKSGILQPLRVERRAGATFLRIRAGHRRAAAAELAGLRKVPCVIVNECDTDEAITEMFAENLQRSGLTTEEKRRNAQRLIEEFGYTPEGVAEAIGVHFTTVYGWLRRGTGSVPLETRPDGRKQRVGGRKAHVPRIKPSAVHALVTQWRERSTDGLSPQQAGELLAGLESLLDGWSPPATSTTSVSDRVVAQVAELDPGHARPVRELAERIGCHPKLVERARAALRRAS